MQLASERTTWPTTIDGCWIALAVGLALAGTWVVVRHEWRVQRPLHELADYERQIVNWERTLDQVKSLVDPSPDGQPPPRGMSGAALRSVLHDVLRAIHDLGATTIPAAGYQKADPFRMTLRLRVLACKAAAETYARRIDIETQNFSPEEPA